MPFFFIIIILIVGEKNALWNVFNISIENIPQCIFMSHVTVGHYLLIVINYLIYLIMNVYCSFFNFNELLSITSPCEAPTKEPTELEVISNFYHRGSNLGPFDSQLNALTTRPRIHISVHRVING